MAKRSLDAEANNNVQYIRWQFLEGWLNGFEKPKHTQTRCSAHHATYHSDRGARGLSGSCLANGPGGCRIFADYCCSVRVCARKQICGLSSRQHLQKKYLLGTKHPFSVGFQSWKLSEPTFVSTCSVHRYYCRRTLYRSISMACIGVPYTVAS